MMNKLHRMLINSWALATAISLCGCAKCGEISVNLNELRGIYKAANTYSVRVDASNRVLEEDMRGGGPAWPGTFTKYYEFCEDGTIVRYTCYSLYGKAPYSEKNTSYWVLKQSEEQAADNIFQFDRNNRTVNTNLWGTEHNYMKVYSADNNEIQLWERITGSNHKGRWYDVFQLLKVSDDKTLAILGDAMEDTEDNEQMILKKIEELCDPAF